MIGASSSTPTSDHVPLEMYAKCSVVAGTATTADAVSWEATDDQPSVAIKPRIKRAGLNSKLEGKELIVGIGEFESMPAYQGAQGATNFRRSVENFRQSLTDNIVVFQVEPIIVRL